MRYDCELNASWQSHDVLISSYKYTLWPGHCTRYSDWAAGRLTNELWFVFR